MVPKSLRLGRLEVAALVLAEVRLLGLVHHHQVAVEIVDPSHHQRTALLWNLIFSLSHK